MEGRVAVMSRWKWWLIILMPLIGLGIWRGYALLERKDLSKEKVKPTVQVQEVQKVKKENVLNYTGTILARDEALISPKVGGKVSRILVQNGERVKAGQSLVELESKDYRTALSASQADLKKAEIQVTTLRSNYVRLKTLYDQGAVSQKDLEEIEAALQAAEADKEKAQAGVQSAEDFLKDTVLVSPIDGVVTNRNIMLGQMAGPGIPLMSVANLDYVCVVINTEPKDLEIIQRPQITAEITVDEQEGERFQGTVEAVNPAANIAARAFETRIKVANPKHQLKPGMFARIKVIAGAPVEVVAVPQNALVSKEGLYFLFTLEKGNQVKRRQVKVGNITGQMVEIKSGLKEGDRVVITNINQLKDLDYVRIAVLEREMEDVSNQTEP